MPSDLRRPPVRRVGELSEFARQQEPNLLPDVDGVVADALKPRRPCSSENPIRGSGSSASSASSCIPRFRRSRGSSIVGSADTGRVLATERFHRGSHHGTRSRPSPRSAALTGWPAGLRELKFGDIHGLIADALQVMVDVQHRRHEPKVARDRRLQGQQFQDPESTRR